jgi:16S rRNA (cytosine1402-N4)-methyltransferase
MLLKHVPVLLSEVLEMLSPQDGAVYFDGTFGGGGYTKAILESANCDVIACDRDAVVKNIADEFSSKYENRFTFLHEKFSKIKSIIDTCGKSKLDGIVLDLGVSNFQLSDSCRGFSFKLDGSLDMSMGLCNETAASIIHNYSEKELADIIYKFGEERFSRRIAKNIKANLSKIKTSTDLANIIRRSVKRFGKIDPATRTFQALRIVVNKELEELEKLLNESINLLNNGGKVIIVSFHSLEDRIVKLFFKGLCKDKFVVLNKKPIIPQNDEIFVNPKSRSAKLRGICMI